MNSVCTIDLIFSSIDFIDHRQGERTKGYSSEDKVCGAPAFRGGPASFICYLLYAINTLGYSPFCFRLTSQILLLD